MYARNMIFEGPTIEELTRSLNANIIKINDVEAQKGMTLVFPVLPISVVATKDGFLGTWTLTFTEKKTQDVCKPASHEHEDFFEIIHGLKTAVSKWYTFSPTRNENLVKLHQQMWGYLQERNLVNEFREWERTK